MPRLRGNVYYLFETQFLVVTHFQNVTILVWLGIPFISPFSGLGSLSQIIRPFLCPIIGLLSMGGLISLIPLARHERTPLIS